MKIPRPPFLRSFSGIVTSGSDLARGSYGFPLSIKLMITESGFFCNASPDSSWTYFRIVLITWNIDENLLNCNIYLCNDFHSAVQLFQLTVNKCKHFHKIFHDCQNIQFLHVQYSLFNIQVINKACYFKNLHDFIGDILYNHFALFFHDLHRSQEYMKSCTGNIFQFSKIKEI